MLVDSLFRAFCKAKVVSESFQKRILSKIRAMEERILENPHAVAVLGPGELDPGFQKRRQIMDALKDDNHDAFMPEDIVNSDSLVPEPEQERLILSETNFIITLNMSAGPLAELSIYYGDSSIISKTFVLSPSQYSSYGTFPSQILDRYMMKYTYSDPEFRRCDLVGVCVRKAKNWRWQQSQGLRSNQF